MEEMEIPEFLKNNDEDDIHEEMLSMIPDKYDKSEGQHYWNFTRPTARIASQNRGFYLPKAISLIWPQFCADEYLDLHAELRNMPRKEAQYATGELNITGTPGTLIPAGYTASTEAKNDTASRDYVTLQDCRIGEDGTVTVPATASEAGAEGNTAANTIVVNTSSYEDVTAVTNYLPFTGGVKEEENDDLYARIHEYDSTQGDSNVGNPSDYKRWAESVPGTGTASIVRATDNSGLVTIILTDGNGEPATETLCTKVYNHIMSPDDELSRLAPCGAVLNVIPPTTSPIVIRATVKLTAGTIQSITEAFEKNLKEYFPEAIEDKEIRYQKVCNVLGDTDGVYDFSELYLNDGMANIPLANGIFPSIDTSDITLTIAE